MWIRSSTWWYVLAPALLALAIVGVACNDDADGSDSTPTVGAEQSAFPLTLTDSSGTEVTLDAAPERIISYSPGATEILFAIGAGDRVVGTDEFSDYPAEALEVPKLTYSAPDPEQALALDPDLVLMASQQREQIEQFRNVGMTVLFMDEAATVEGVMDDVRLLGQITGLESEATDLAEAMRVRIDDITTSLDDIEAGPRVFFELTSDLYTVAPNTFVGDLLTLLKAQNVADGAPSPFPQLIAEALVASDPEVVLLADGEFGESLETVCARPGWSAVSACVSERVHPVDADLTNRPGPRVVDGLEEIARLLYPERFP